MPGGAAYRSRVEAALAALGIAADWPARHQLPLVIEARRLTPVGLGTDGRDKLLGYSAARAWRTMRAQAAADGVELQLVSAFRSVEFQTALIAAKLQRGMALDEVLRINAPPGYSEHHGGQALDIGTPGCAALDEAFELTPAFAWLNAHAPRHGFSLSYPRGNRQGFLYEPWHWCFGTRVSSPA
ncbi:MAG TPA: M15 family metallopeptidase [Fontimonas sp.]